MATERQKLLLKFWGRLDLADRDVEEVSAWLDEHQEDSWSNVTKLRRHCAWMLFKLDFPEFDRDGDGKLENLPEGVGSLMLEKLEAIEQKLGQADTLEELRYGEYPKGYHEVLARGRKASRKSGCLGVVLLLAPGCVLVAYGLLKSWSQV